MVTNGYFQNAKGLMKTPGWYNKSAEKEFKHILYKVGQWDAKLHKIKEHHP